MPFAEPRQRVDLWSLVAIYAAVATIVVEANYQLPLALLDEWGRICGTEPVFRAWYRRFAIGLARALAA